MTSGTTQFFKELGEREHEPMLENATGVVRFDILDNGRSERWVVTIDSGDIGVSRGNVAGDCRLRMRRELFEQVVRGDASAAAAVFRGAIQVEGDWRLLVLAQRLLRQPEEARQ